MFPLDSPCCRDFLSLQVPAFGTVSHFERLIDGAQHQGRFARLLFLQLSRFASMTELSLQFFFVVFVYFSPIYTPISYFLFAIDATHPTHA